MVLIRPQKEKQGALLNEKGAIPVDSADKDIMSFTLKNVIDELTDSSGSRVYKYNNDYLIFTPIKRTIWTTLLLTSPNCG